MSSQHFVDGNHAFITGHLVMAMSMAHPSWADGEYRVELIDDADGNHTKQARVIVRGHSYLVTVEVDEVDDDESDDADG